jgi:glutathione S-transferase
VFQGCGNVIAFQRVVGPKLMGLTPDLTAIEAAMPNARRVFNELGRLLGDKPYFAGDQISLAEMMLIPQMDFMSQAPEWIELTAALPNIVNWFERAVARACFRATTWEKVVTASLVAVHQDSR